MGYELVCTWWGGANSEGGGVWRGWDDSGVCGNPDTETETRSSFDCAHHVPTTNERLLLGGRWLCFIHICPIILCFHRHL
jgi:hypothetical protein